MTNLPRPRSLGNKLSLLFFGITAAAFAVIFFFVVPQLEDRLTNRELDALEQAAEETAGPLAEAVESSQTEEELNVTVRRVADQANAVVTLLSSQRSGVGSVEAVRPYVLSDSRAQREIDEPLRLAERVFLGDRPAGATATVAGERIARYALPLDLDGEPVWVAVWTRSLEDVTDTVGVVRRQVLLATAIALMVALIGGWLVARALARRVARVEHAAERVAAGEFAGPLLVDSDDELGQLTRTFNKMQVQLAQVDRARKEFIATASHELRTPIMSLGGFIELLQDEELDPATREEFLQTMGEQVERLQKLSVDLLDLSRLDAGSVTLQPESVNLGELLRAVAREFAPALKDRKDDLELEARTVNATCDRERTAQIMRILMDNAIRHTEAGTQVSAGVERRDGAAVVRVVDEGPGLGGEAEQVFERFYTGDAARGSGLGLAIARELAELMDGTIEVASRPGETAFTLELPAA
ncbi:MAG TPA: HAMP domain-containing sensor histidine kinase [Thermoleophilaceae bacterium]|nr:HAMP domain-containing sensor histidine kinase [Thermoleophilaceae bacterium]